MEWVITRALNKQYESTDELLADVKRTWGVLEERWTRERSNNKMEALQEIKRAFEDKWRSKGIGERGGLVCIPSVGISRDAFELPRSLTPTYSHNSAVGEAPQANASDVGPLALKVDGKERATRRALQTCARVIETFIKTEEALYFREPVDPVAMQCPDYWNVVKQPMDLSTLLAKIRLGEIATPLEVWEASKLIWDNCRLYNPPGNAIVKICNVAESRFNAAWRSEGLHKVVEASPEVSEARTSPVRKPSTASTASRQSAMNRTWSSSTGAPPQERAGSKPSTTGRASRKCDVCKRSKKGKCGTDTAPKSCLARPENQNSDRQYAILDRVSRLKPLPAKKPMELKRKITEAQEAQEQEDGFRTLFDENDPDNFISQFAAHQRQARQRDMSQQSLHLANEQLRLQTMQNRQLARFDVQMLAQPAQPAPNFPVGTLSAEDKAQAVTLQNELVNVVTCLNRAYLNQQRCSKVLNRPELSPMHVAEVRRAQAGQQMIIHKLQQRHQECSKKLQMYVQRGYRIPAAPPRVMSNSMAAPPLPTLSSPTMTIKATRAPYATQMPPLSMLQDDFDDFASLNDGSISVAEVFDDKDPKRDFAGDIPLLGPSDDVDIDHIERLVA